jgi:hypothetical protein
MGTHALGLPVVSNGKGLTLGLTVTNRNYRWGEGVILYGAQNPFNLYLTLYFANSVNILHLTLNVDKNLAFYIVVCL